MLVSPTCATCGDSAPSKKCGRCQKMYYCSRGCQKSHWRTHKLTCRPSTFTAKLMAMDGAIITVKVAMDDETERLFVAVEEALREGHRRDANLPDSDEGFELYIRDQAIQRGKQISEYQRIEKVIISAVGIGVRWREYRWQSWREFAGLPERRRPDYHPLRE